MKKVGKKTPVWLNANTGKVVCGDTIQDALGVGFTFDPGPGWKKVNQLPRDKRVVICDGKVMPRNIFTEAIAKEADKPGILEIKIGSAIHRATVIFVNAVKVIVV